MRGARLRRTRLGRRVARMVRRVRAARSRGVSRPQHPSARATRALALLRDVESREDVLPVATARRVFLVRDRAVIAADLAGISSHLVPAPLRGKVRRGSAHVTEVSERVAAEVLTLAKFDLGDQIKLRAHYVGSQLTVAAQAPVRGGTDGVLNAVRAHEVVARHARGLAPRLLGHGQLADGVRYLVEEWVDGSPVMTPGGLAWAAPQVLEGLARLHHGYGVSWVPVSTAWGDVLGERWDRTVATGVVDRSIGEEVARLIRTDRQVRISWTHGDLVASNVLRTADDRVVLIDWEHSREDVVMRDAAKLHLFSAEPDQTLELALNLLGDGASGASGAGPGVELALAHAQLVARYPARRSMLEGHARAEVYERQVRRQVELLAQVLERSG